MYAIWRRLRREVSSRHGSRKQEPGRRKWGICSLAVEPLEDRMLLAAGELDPTFGNGGRVVTAFEGPLYGTANAVFLQSDGKLVLAGITGLVGTYGDFALVRYLPDGSLDPSFGTAGQALTRLPSTVSLLRSVAATAAMQPDGKIVVAGMVGPEPRRDFAVVRFNPDGTLDATFGNAGLVQTPFEQTATPSAISVDRAGRIIVAGTLSPGLPGGSSVLVRYTPRGSLDPSFGTGGKVTSPLGTANGLALQEDGKIVVAGTSVQGFTIARYVAEGSPDASFGTGGVVALNLNASPFSAEGGSVLVQPNGKIVLGGTLSRIVHGLFTNHLVLARVDSNGSLDPSFGAGGVVRNTSFNATVSNLALQPDGKLITAGNRPTLGQPLGFQMTRWNANGTLDTDFGSNGEVRSDFGNFGSGFGKVSGIALQPNGRIVAAGFAGDVSQQRFALNRYTNAGALDNSFATGGRVVTNLRGPVSSPPRAVLLQPDGKVVIAGYNFQQADRQSVLARYTATGSLDTSFGSGGRVTTPLNGGTSLEDAVLQPDGKILALGALPGASVLVRYHPDGSLDASYGDGGRVQVRLHESGNSVAQVLVLQPDTKVVVAGRVTLRGGGDPLETVGLARFNPDGSRDASFNPVFPELLPQVPNAFVSSLALQGDGKILLSVSVGNFTQAQQVSAVVRYDPTGNLDRAFGRDGILVSDRTGRIRLQSDGKILLASVRSDRSALLTRYSADGTLDPTFGAGGRTNLGFEQTLTNESTPDLVVLPNGKIVVVGRSGNNLSLTRLDPNGSLDPLFGQGGLAVTDLAVEINDLGTVRLALQPDGRIVTASTVRAGNVIHFGVARFLTDDSVANPNQRYVTQLYVDLLLRAPDFGGLNAFVTALDRSQLTRGQLVQIFTATAEYRQVLVRNLYATLLQRPADPGGLNFFAGFLGSGGTVAQLKAILIGSAEYFQRRGNNTNEGFLTALYSDVLAREADPGGRQVFGQALAAGVSRTSLAGAILTSQEALEGIVRGWYARFLRRPADPNGVTGFVAALRQGMREEQLVSVFTGSDEYVGRL